MFDKEKLPDCEDITTDCGSDVEAMATRRANCAVGDCRSGKRMDLHMALSDLIRHEVESAYLAGYSQAITDSQEKP